VIIKKDLLINCYSEKPEKTMKKPPIFIVGCPRSGTTLARVILDSHPNICCGPETHIIKNLKQFNNKTMENWKMLKPFQFSKKDFYIKQGEILKVFCENLMKIKKKQRWCEKTPDNIFHIDFINKIFPDCQFINIIRDGRDVVSSFKNRYGRIAIYTGIKKWNKAMDMIEKYRKEFSKDRYLEVRYEELVTDPEKNTKKMMQFLNEEWTPALLEHHKFKHEYWFNPKTKENVDFEKEKKPLRHSPSRPIFTSSTGRWKKDLNILEKAIVNLLLDKNLKKMNYK